MDKTRRNNNIVLIGMPGAGKSTIGVLLAKPLGLSFIDTDLIIQRQEGRLLQDIIDDQGIDYFLSVEERAILGLETAHHVIATGGSVVYSAAAAAYLKEGGQLIYLKLAYETIACRVKDMKSRGIVIRRGQRLRDIYRERVPLYERYAAHTVDCEGRSMESIVDEIFRLYSEGGV